MTLDYRWKLTDVARVFEHSFVNCKQLCVTGGCGKKPWCHIYVTVSSERINSSLKKLFVVAPPQKVLNLNQFHPFPTSFLSPYKFCV